MNKPFSPQEKTFSVISNKGTSKTTDSVVITFLFSFFSEMPEINQSNYVLSNEARESCDLAGA